MLLSYGFWYISKNHKGKQNCNSSKKKLFHFPAMGSKGHMPLIKFDIICFCPWLKKLSRGAKGVDAKTSLTLVIIRYSAYDGNISASFPLKNGIWWKILNTHYQRKKEKHLCRKKVIIYLSMKSYRP